MFVTFHTIYDMLTNVEKIESENSTTEKLNNDAFTNFSTHFGDSYGPINILAVLKVKDSAIAKKCLGPAWNEEKKDWKACLSIAKALQKTSNR